MSKTAQESLLREKKAEYLQELASQGGSEGHPGQLLPTESEQSPFLSRPVELLAITDISMLHERLKATLEELEGKQELLDTLKSLPPSVPLARLELAKLQDQVRQLGKQRRQGFLQ
ncbi:hypothetical protein HDV03_001792 [Kappamyces sp. JEL0829]|nr:hypothetical protein HDV03_001792 [Kappamyces sp. JEL0829]